MKRLLGVCVVWVLMVGVAFAYEVTVTEVTTPYEIIPITPAEAAQVWHLGKLEDHPVMYEFTATEPLELSLELRTVAGQLPDAMKPSLMVVRVNDDGSGVTEVARLVGREVSWQTTKESLYGLTFSTAPVLLRTYEPGVYRVEVSTPNNQGPYVLLVGSASEPVGYFATIGQVRLVQRHFGYSFIKVLTSSYVYYPLGSFLLLLVLYRTWKYHTKIRHGT